MVLRSLINLNYLLLISQTLLEFLLSSIWLTQSFNLSILLDYFLRSAATVYFRRTHWLGYLRLIRLLRAVDPGNDEDWRCRHFCVGFPRPLFAD